MATSPQPKSRPFTLKQRRFIEEMPTAGSQADAVRRVYDVGNNRHLAEVIGSENMRKPEIAKAVAVALNTAAEKAGVTAEWAFNRLHLNVERSLQAIPVLDRKGKPTGEYQYEPAAVNRGVELAMRHLRLLGDDPAATGDVHNTVIFNKYSLEELDAMLEAVKARNAGKKGPDVL